MVVFLWGRFPTCRSFGRLETCPTTEQGVPAVPRAKTEWWVYVLRRKDGTPYTGITTDPARRVTQHNDGTASEPAMENTLEAFRATFLLGGDGNEFDIRTTSDGVLVVFHDDMLDRHLAAYGDLSEYTWAELQRFRFRAPGRFGEYCRIPTL